MLATADILSISCSFKVFYGFSLSFIWVLSIDTINEFFLAGDRESYFLPGDSLDKAYFIFGMIGASLGFKLMMLFICLASSIEFII